MTVPWETVRIFISSTFDDMHAERDYLVKQVFPELREWCERRKLRLVDIDLRWGVKETDTENQNVVQVCLRRIDEARPFFLCFLGQRRGWVPQKENISAATLSEADGFPDLEEMIGKASVTEMEILHALVTPFHLSRTVKDKSGEYYKAVKYSLFYLRDRSYLSALPDDFPQLRKVYTNDGIKDKDDREEADRALKQWVGQEIPILCQKYNRPMRIYNARWNPNARSPELLMPLECPSLVKANVEQWQRKWADGGIVISGTSIDIPELVKRAEEYNRRRSSGRLTGFEIDGKPLSRIIVEDLQAAIMARFPDHVEIGAESDLQQELDQQEQFLFSASEGFIERKGDFDELDSYVKGDSRQLFVITAPGGMGKSSLLAKWVDRYRLIIEGKADQSIHFRFIGQSDRSTTVYSLLGLLLNELKEISGKFKGEIPQDPQKLSQEFPRLLEVAGMAGKTVIVLDALNQLESGLSDLTWLPYQLPENIKLIVSFKSGESDADNLIMRMRGQVILSEVRPFTSIDHRLALVNRYLEQYLKQLDQPLLNALINLPGASNPLYLKVVLSELRVFGAFANLNEKIRSEFGETPVEAFLAVLKRLESDPAYSSIAPNDAVPLLFGLLSHARYGLSVDELSDIFASLVGKEKEVAAETINLYLRQVRPFLAHRDGRYDFFFESFKTATHIRYNGESSPAKQANDWHILLADYFEGLPLTHRKVQELPWQLAQSASWQRLATQLTDGDLLSQAFLYNEYDVKRYWQRIESNSPIRMVRTYLPIIESDRISHNFMYALAKLFADTGHIKESLLLRKRLTDFYREHNEREALCNSLSHQADLLFKQSDYSSALSLWQEQEQLARDLGLTINMAFSLGNQSTVQLNMGDIAEARRLADEAIRIFRTSGKEGESGLGLFLNTLASIYQKEGKLSSALEMFREAERINRDLGQLERTAGSIGNRGEILAEMGKLNEAMACYKEQQQICEEIGDTVGLAASIDLQGNLLWDRGEPGQALVCFQKSAKIYRDSRLMDRLAAALGQQAQAYCMQSDFEQALEASEESEQLFRDLRDQYGLATAIGNHAIILTEKGDLVKALPLLEEARQLLQQLNHVEDVARMLMVETLVYQNLNQADRALDCANEALAVQYELEKTFRNNGNQPGLVLALFNQARILMLKGRYRAALSMAEEAHHLAVANDLTSLANQIQTMIQELLDNT